MDAPVQEEDKRPCFNVLHDKCGARTSFHIHFFDTGVRILRHVAVAREEVRTLRNAEVLKGRCLSPSRASWMAPGVTRR
jgi:hypothetical protein